jgi:hypothetical protein
MTSGNLLSTPTASDATQGAVIGKKDKFYRLPSGRMRKINGNGVDGSIGLAREIALTSTSSQEDSHASLLVRQDKDEARKMTAFSGRKCLELFRNSGPLGSLARMLLDSLAWQSSMVSLKWQVKPIYSEILSTYTPNEDAESSTESLENLSKSATPSRHLLFQLAPSERPTEGTECGLLGEGLMGTPRAMEIPRSEKFLQKEKGIKRVPTPSEVIGEINRRNRLLPTHRAGNPGSRPNGKGGKVLAEEIQKAGLGLPPTTSCDYKSRGPNSKQGGIDQTIKMLGTPRVNTNGSTGYPRESHKSRLEDQVATMLMTPANMDYRTGMPGRFEDKRRTKNVNDQLSDILPPNNGTKTGLKLQPAFVEWMMGYPEKWTELPCPKQDTASSD